jgi:hypothetical protein
MYIMISIGIKLLCQCTPIWRSQKKTERAIRMRDINFLRVDYENATGQRDETNHKFRPGRSWCMHEFPSLSNIALCKCATTSRYCTPVNYTKFIATILMFDHKSSGRNMEPISRCIIHDHTLREWCSNLSFYSVTPL